MAAGRAGRERRRWPRAPLRGTVVGQIYTEHAAPILDLSEGGALLEVPCALRPGSVYSVRLAIRPETVLTVKASVVRSQVHRVESAGQGETVIRYHAALHFVDLTASDHALLRERIASEVPSGTAGLTQAAAAAEEALERRESRRVDLPPPVASELGLRLESRVLLLSPGGMTLRMPFRPEVDSTVTCTLDIAGASTPLRCVVRDTYRDVDEGHRAEFVVGVEFVGLADEARAAIAAYLERIG